MSVTPADRQPTASRAEKTTYDSWLRARYGLAVFWFGSLLGAWTVLRVVLLLAFRHEAISVGDVSRIFGAGLYRDILAALIFTVPMLLWFLIVPNRSFSKKWHRVLFAIALFISCFAQIFLLFVEFFFFEEFKSRFNTVAVDYLLCPQEVFVNIWESYHVGLVLAICLALTLGWLWAANRLFRQMWNLPFSGKSRFLRFGIVTALAGLLALTLNLKGAHVGNDRTLNEIANNGALSFVVASRTRHLDYAAFYKTLPKT